MRFIMDVLCREKGKSNVVTYALFRKTNDRPVLNDVVSQFRKLGHCEVWMKDDKTTFVVYGNYQDAQNVYLECVLECVMECVVQLPVPLPQDPAPLLLLAALPLFCNSEFFAFFSSNCCKLVTSTKVWWHPGTSPRGICPLFFPFPCWCYCYQGGRLYGPILSCFRPRIMCSFFLSNL